MRARRRVLIVEPQIKQYRKPFFEKLAARLDEADVALRVVYSPPQGSELAKGDTTDLDPRIGIEVRGWWLLGERVLVQPIWQHVRAADLVITEQGNRVAFNLVLLALSRAGIQRVAYWGHGYNHQAREPGMSEWLKRKLVTRVDWWFAYTRSVAGYLDAHGVDPRTITVVQNTIDTDELVGAIAQVDAGAVRRRLGIADDAQIGLFCGSLYEDKLLGLLVEAAVQIRAQRPSFELVIVGDGVQRDEVRAAAARHPFVHHVGPVFGAARAEFFAISDVFLMPGVVGVAIVDAFAAGLPVVTTTIPTHGPEIEYLEPGHNGAMTAPDVAAYADAVTGMLADEHELARLREGARATAGRLTMAHMVDAFATGILECLS